MTDERLIGEILDFWFGELDHAGMAAPELHRRWFQAGDEDDEEIRRRFGAAVEAALAGDLDHWAESATGLVALVILLDQFTRNIFRGTPRAFAGDDKALARARAAVNRGADTVMPAIHRVFLYIPYEHAEDLDTQEAGIARFDSLLETGDPSARETLTDFRRYCVAHRDVIARFGRFPHRNRILGRDSTEDELAHLERHGGF